MRSSPLRHPARAAGSSLLRLQSDERLAELARGGHEAAFDAIVVRYRTALTRYCAGIVGPSRADDAVQQTLINAHDALPKVDDVRHLRSWLYRIAHNVSLNVLRGVRDDVSLEDATASPALAADGPAASFERSEQFRATVAALQALPERQRAALVLRELEGRSHEEIADALGVSKGSARQHLMRARVAMRGAVTAITPYPLVVRLADLLSASGGGAAPWGDAVVGGAGVGLGAGLMKATAGVVATGALVGGAAVGTDRVVGHGGDAGPARAAEVVAQPAANAAPVSRAARAPASAPAATVPTTTVATARKRPAAGSRGKDDNKGRGRSGKAPRQGPPAAVAPAVTDDAAATSGPSGATVPSHGRRGRRDDEGGKDDDKGSGRGDDGRGRSLGRSGKRGKGEQRGTRDDGGSGRGASGSGRSSDGSGSSGSSGSSGRGSGDDDTAVPQPTTPVTPATATPPAVTAPGDSSDAGDSGSGKSGSDTSGDDE
ncbi:RNA polymerase sigma factor [Baekduia alba]|uniref:RNA polymerase sigma factor n=1 Tax=Baekduia alba TaxID=2997333 RepID=UPI00234259D9|nr:sigma-70 family RNA polymerase sigma factor [Baekduia alba]WCB94735.1 RNA polymerase sigma factor [Baekduia alba]